MSRSSGRGQVEPLPALVAVAAVCLGLTLYAGGLRTATPSVHGPNAEGALDAVHDHAARNGVVVPERLRRAPTPAGRRTNATLTVGNRSWSVGPTPPDGDARATWRVSVRLGPGRIRPGRLTVVVW